MEGKLALPDKWPEDFQYTDEQGLTDEQAKAIMKRVSGCDNASAFQLLTAKRQKEVLSTMLEKGVSVRQAARMTGVPKTTVARCSG